MTTIYGIGPDGKSKPVQLDADGNLIVAGAAGGGGAGGGDASAANQTTMIARLTTIDADLGALDATPAAADGTGDYSLVAAAKRALLNWAALLGRLPAGLGAKTGAASLSVVPATDALFTVTDSNTATLVDASAGAAFAALSAGACRAVYIENNRPLAVDLEVRRGGSGGTRVVPAGSGGMFDAVTNAGQLQLRRLDGLATAVTVSTELRA